MSAKAEYAVRAMVQLATVPSGTLAKTDDLAQVPFDHMSDQEVALLLGALRACAAEVQSSGLLPFPNPMGLPTLD